MEDIQEHIIKDGKGKTKPVFISRNGKHQYKIKYSEDGDWVKPYYGNAVPSATSIIKHLEGDTFGIGMAWAMKLAKESGEPYQARIESEKAMESGNELHDCIDRFIKSNGSDIAEDNKMFNTWYRDVGSLPENKFLKGELFVYAPYSEFGGTIDGISMNPDTGEITIWDWKTKERGSFEKYGSPIKDHVQLAGYFLALREMGSIYAPVKANVVYLMRDGSSSKIVPVDLEFNEGLFAQSFDLYKTLRVAKNRNSNLNSSLVGA